MEKLKLTFKGWNRLVCHLFGFTSVFVKTCCISPLDSEANRDGVDAESPCPCFSLFLLHLRNLAQEKRSEIFLRFVISGPSLFVSTIVTKYNIFAELTIASCAIYWLPGSASYVIT